MKDKRMEKALFRKEGGLLGMYDKGKKAEADELFDDAVKKGKMVRLF